jgi:hypothetical protein
MTQLEQLPATGHQAKVRWFYKDGDEDMQEAGEEFESIVDIDFELVQIQDQDETKEDDFFDNMMDDIM